MAWVDIGTAASLATTISVVLLLYRIMLNDRRETARFEDELVGEYREIADELPLKALLGKKLSDDEYEGSLSDFYRYIDLCNEQVFLRQEDQIRKETWKNWRDGIESNLARPAFERAWSEVKSRSKSESHKDFSELRRLEKEFNAESQNLDPYLWDSDIDGRAKHNWRLAASFLSNLFWVVTWPFSWLFEKLIRFFRSTVECCAGNENNK